MLPAATPAVGPRFAGRQAELLELFDVVDELEGGGAPRRLLVGPARVGRSSLLLELGRRARRRGIWFVTFDASDGHPPCPEHVRRFALATLDVFAAPDGGSSITSPAACRDAVRRSRRLSALPPALLGEIGDLAEGRLDARLIRACLDLPERLATALGGRFVVGFDGFDRLAAARRRRGSPTLAQLALETWSAHERVAWILGCAHPGRLEPLLEAAVTTFSLPEHRILVGPLEPTVGSDWLASGLPDRSPVPPDVARLAATVLWGHPFYLQVLAEALDAQPKPLDARSLRSALQAVLFSRTGTLAMHFERVYDRLVGRSVGLATVLDALAPGPCRITDVARVVGSPTGATVGYIRRLGDAVARHGARLYGLADPVFARWLRWRLPGGCVVPMSLVGEAVEERVAEALHAAGFDVRYPSRGSRAVFDLVGQRAGRPVGLRIVESGLPVTLSPAGWEQLEEAARPLQGRWLVARVSTDAVQWLDPRCARRERRVVLDGDAALDNPVLWLR